VQGAKAYILPAVAALLLLGWWVFAPSLDDTPDEPTPAGDGALPSPAPAAPAGPLDAALDAAIEGCGDARGITELRARIGRDAQGQAAIETVTLTPADVTGAVADCLRALAGTSLPTQAPIAPVDRRRTFGA
jgi:hypothetical protein